MIDYFFRFNSEAQAKSADELSAYRYQGGVWKTQKVIPDVRFELVAGESALTGWFCLVRECGVVPSLIDAASLVLARDTISGDVIASKIWEYLSDLRIHPVFFGSVHSPLGVERPDGNDAMNVLAYGAVGDGSTDDHEAIQSAIDATPEGGSLYVPAKTFAISDELTISKNMSVVGAGVYSVRSAFGVSNNWSSPGTAPILQGALFKPTTAGKNCFNLPGSATVVHLRDFGIRFASGLASTGHGINAVSTDVYETKPDHGPFDCRWSNIFVYGHDGDHYGFRLVNPCYCTMDNLRSWGGGGFSIETSSGAGNYGNSVLVNPMIAIIRSGTAHGIHCKGEQLGGSSGVMNLMSFVLPQVIVTGGANKSVQHAFKAEFLDLSSIDVSDFEPGDALVDYGTGRVSLTQAGIHGSLTGTKFIIERSEHGSVARYSDGSVS